MKENFGKEYWHLSSRGRKANCSERVSLRGVLIWTGEKRYIMIETDRTLGTVGSRVFGK